MKKAKAIVGLSALTLTLAGMFSFKPARKFASLTKVYAAGYGLLFGGTPQVNWTSIKGLSGHTAFFKTISGLLSTLKTSNQPFFEYKLLLANKGGYRYRN